MEKDIGTILRLQALGEHGLIVTWCSAAHGLIRTAARGARKPGSDYTGRLDLFHECELLFTPARSGDLHTLGSVNLLTPRLGLRQDLTRLRLASYMTRLLLATVEPTAHINTTHISPLHTSPAPITPVLPDEAAWHHLLASALDYLERPTTVPRAAILHRFERRLAELHGLYSPTLAPHTALLNHFQNLPPNRPDLLAVLT